MMKIVFEANLENGEAHVSDKTMDELNELSALMAADLLLDVYHATYELYAKHVERMRDDFQAKRAGSGQ